jgi:hypothetical protein
MEARDSLVDAAESYEREGLAREGAERRAVAEFGRVREIGPGYQAELDVSQARRTALTVVFVLAAHPIVCPGPGREQGTRARDRGCRRLLDA